MDLFEATELAREYNPPVFYTVTEIKEKSSVSNRELHEEMVGCPAYPLFLKVGERGWIMCKLCLLGEQPQWVGKSQKVQQAVG